MWVVTDTTDYDAVNPTGAVTFYNYDGGKWNLKERQFLGFAGSSVVRTKNYASLSKTLDPINPIEITYYSQNLACAGRPTRIEFDLDLSTVLKAEEFSYSADTVAPFRCLQTNAYKIEGNLNNYRKSRTYYQYDNYVASTNITRYGNLVRRVDFGLVDPITPTTDLDTTDTVSSGFSYGLNNNVRATSWDAKMAVLQLLAT